MPGPARHLRSRNVCALIALLLTTSADADQVMIAVAANFLNPLRAIAEEFAGVSGHEPIIVSGSTGQLYAQIVNGAPYEVLLAADSERPRLLAEDGHGVPGTVMTYAFGRLALWSRDESAVDDGTLSMLGELPFRSFAIAVPEVAPYGQAARQVLENLGLWQRIEPRLVRGQNIAQTFAMIETRNAEMGLVALSQALGYQAGGSYRIVPDSLHDPIRQDAILLSAGADRAAAIGFLAFLRGPAARELIADFGYSVPEDAR